MSTRSCSLRWTWPPHKEHAEWSAAGVWGARLMCWMLVSVPARRRGHPGQFRKGGGQEAPPGAIICWDWQAGCPSCACVFSSSSWYGYTGGVLGCPQGVAHLHCPQSCSCRLGCGCESLSWPASCHCAAEEIKRNKEKQHNEGWLGNKRHYCHGRLAHPSSCELSLAAVSLSNKGSGWSDGGQW